MRTAARPPGRPLQLPALARRRRPPRSSRPRSGWKARGRPCRTAVRPRGQYRCIHGQPVPMPSRHRAAGSRPRSTASSRTTCGCSWPTAPWMTPRPSGCVAPACLSSGGPLPQRQAGRLATQRSAALPGLGRSSPAARGQQQPGAPAPLQPQLPSSCTAAGHSRARPAAPRRTPGRACPDPTRSLLTQRLPSPAAADGGAQEEQLCDLCGPHQQPHTRRGHQGGRAAQRLPRPWPRLPLPQARQHAAEAQWRA
jgi:hypothetical protein